LPTDAGGVDVTGATITDHMSSAGHSNELAVTMKPHKGRGKAQTHTRTQTQTHTDKQTDIHTHTHTHTHTHAGPASSE
jgi:hypothetical protein